MFLWRLFSRILPTKEGIWLKTKKGYKDCILFGEATETELHLFKQCSFVKAVAFGSQWGIRMERIGGETLNEIMEFMFGTGRQTGQEVVDRDLLILILASLFDAVWKAKNLKLHNGCCNIEKMVSGCEGFVKEIFSLLEREPHIQDGGLQMGRAVEVPTWRPAEQGIVTVNVDAAIGREKRGMALVARDHRGKLIHLKSLLADITSPKEAEIKALMWATDFAAMENWGRIEWRCNA